MSWCSSGQIIELLGEREDNEHWWRVRDEDGNTGCVPASYVIKKEAQVNTNNNNNNNKNNKINSRAGPAVAGDGGSEERDGGEEREGEATATAERGGGGKRLWSCTESRLKTLRFCLQQVRHNCRYK